MSLGVGLERSRLCKTCSRRQLLLVGQEEGKHDVQGQDLQATTLTDVGGIQVGSPQVVKLGRSAVKGCCAGAGQTA